MRFLDLIEIELSRLGPLATGAVAAAVALQPWLMVEIREASTVVGIESLQELADHIVAASAAGLVGSMYTVVTVVTAGYAAYSVHSDLSGGLTQTILSYPVRRREYFLAKVVAALTVAAAPAAFSATIRALSFVEEDPSRLPLHVILIPILMQALPAALWSVLISLVMRGEFMSSLVSAAVPWLVEAGFDPGAAHPDLRLALPHLYQEALVVGKPAPAVLSCAALTAAFLALLEVSLRRMEVT